MISDYYKILGITSSASLVEIRKAYRQLAMRFHPDKNNSTDAHDRFIEIHEAYEVLRNVQKREYYDKLYNEYFLKERNASTGEKEKWEHSIHLASDAGRKRGEKYEEDYNLFSRKVIKTAFFSLIFQLIISLIFGDISHIGILLGLVLLIGGVVVVVLNFDTTGIILGSLLSILGFFISLGELKQFAKELNEQ